MAALRRERKFEVAKKYAYLLARLLEVDPAVLVGPPDADGQAQLERDLEDLGRRWRKQRKDLGKKS